MAFKRITVDEVDHIRFIRRVFGKAAVARPNVDLLDIAYNGVPAGSGFFPDRVNGTIR